MYTYFERQLRLDLFPKTIPEVINSCFVRVSRDPFEIQMLKFSVQRTARNRSFCIPQFFACTCTSTCVYGSTVYLSRLLDCMIKKRNSFTNVVLE